MPDERVPSNSRCQNPPLSVFIRYRRLKEGVLTRVACSRCTNIGRRLEVYWPKEKKVFYGTVAQYHGLSGKHRVHYDDEESEWLMLSKENFMWHGNQLYTQEEVEAIRAEIAPPQAQLMALQDSGLIGVRACDSELKESVDGKWMPVALFLRRAVPECFEIQCGRHVATLETRTQEVEVWDSTKRESKRKDVGKWVRPIIEAHRTWQDACTVRGLKLRYAGSYEQDLSVRDYLKWTGVNDRTGARLEQLRKNQEAVTEYQVHLGCIRKSAEMAANGPPMGPTPQAGANPQGQGSPATQALDAHAADAGARSAAGNPDSCDAAQTGAVDPNGAGPSGRGSATDAPATDSAGKSARRSPPQAASALPWHCTHRSVCRELSCDDHPLLTEAPLHELALHELAQVLHAVRQCARSPASYAWPEEDEEEQEQEEEEACAVPQAPSAPRSTASPAPDLVAMKRAAPSAARPSAGRGSCAAASASRVRKAPPSPLEGLPASLQRPKKQARVEGCKHEAKPQFFARPAAKPRAAVQGTQGGQQTSSKRAVKSEPCRGTSKRPAPPASKRNAAPRAAAQEIANVDKGALPRAASEPSPGRPSTTREAPPTTPSTPGCSHPLGQPNTTPQAPPATQTLAKPHETAERSSPGPQRPRSPSPPRSPAPASPAPAPHTPPPAARMLPPFSSASAFWRVVDRRVEGEEVLGIVQGYDEAGYFVVEFNEQAMDWVHPTCSNVEWLPANEPHIPATGAGQASSSGRQQRPHQPAAPAASPSVKRESSPDSSTAQAADRHGDTSARPMASPSLPRSPAQHRAADAARDDDAGTAAHDANRRSQGATPAAAAHGSAPPPADAAQPAARAAAATAAEQPGDPATQPGANIQARSDTPPAAQSRDEEHRPAAGPRAHDHAASTSAGNSAQAMQGATAAAAAHRAEPPPADEAQPSTSAAAVTAAEQRREVHAQPGGLQLGSQLQQQAVPNLHQPPVLEQREHEHGTSSSGNSGDTQTHSARCDPEDSYLVNQADSRAWAPAEAAAAAPTPAACAQGIQPTSIQPAVHTDVAADRQHSQPASSPAAAAQTPPCGPGTSRPDAALPNAPTARFNPGFGCLDKLAAPGCRTLGIARHLLNFDIPSMEPFLLSLIRTSTSIEDVKEWVGAIKKVFPHAGGAPDEQAKAARDPHIEADGSEEIPRSFGEFCDMLQSGESLGEVHKMLSLWGELGRLHPEEFSSVSQDMECHLMSSTSIVDAREWITVYRALGHAMACNDGHHYGYDMFFDMLQGCSTTGQVHKVTTVWTALAQSRADSFEILSAQVARSFHDSENLEAVSEMIESYKLLGFDNLRLLDERCK